MSARAAVGLARRTRAAVAGATAVGLARRTRTALAGATAVCPQAGTGRSVALLVTLAVASVVLPVGVQAGSPSSHGDPWETRDRMAQAGAVPAHPGVRVALAVTSWEALDGDLRTDLRAAWEPEHRLGFSLGWSRYWLPGATAADDLEALAVVRTNGARLAGGGGLLRRGVHRVTRWVAAGDARVFGPLLAGARAAVYPDGESWAPEITTDLCVAWGPWHGGLELGPRSGDLCLSVGLAARPNLVWTTSWAGDHPRLGVAWGFGAAELRASQASHPLLGTVQNLAVVMGGRTP